MGTILIFIIVSFVLGLLFGLIEWKKSQWANIMKIAFVIFALCFFSSGNMPTFWVFVFVGILSGVMYFGANLTGRGDSGSSRSQASTDMPNYNNWDRIYDSLRDSESQHVIATTKEKAIQHFRSDRSKTLHSFQENDALCAISRYETDFLFGFFDEFEGVIEDADFLMHGENGECFLIYHHPNGQKWTYHHWPYRENIDLDISMRRGEITRGQSFLRYGLSSAPALQYWKTYDDGGMFVGFDPSKGIVENRRL